MVTGIRIGLQMRGRGSNSYVEIYKDIHLKSFSKKNLVKNAVTDVEASRVGFDSSLFKS